MRCLGAPQAVRAIKIWPSAATPPGIAKGDKSHLAQLSAQLALLFGCLGVFAHLVRGFSRGFFRLVTCPGSWAASLLPAHSTPRLDQSNRAPRRWRMEKHQHDRQNPQSVQVQSSSHGLHPRSKFRVSSSQDGHTRQSQNAPPECMLAGKIFHRQGRARLATPVSAPRNLRTGFPGPGWVRGRGWASGGV